MEDSPILYSDPMEGARILYSKNGPSIQPGIENSNGRVKWFFPRGEIWRFKEGMAVVDEYIDMDGWFLTQSGVIDLSGNWLVGKKYNLIDNCGEGRFFASMEDEGDTYLLDALGNVIKQYNELTYIDEFSEGLAMMWRGASDLSPAQFAYINREGDEIIPSFSQIGIALELGKDGCSEGLIRFFREGKWGYIDKANQIVIPFIYEDGTRFGNNLAGVKLKDKFGFIDRNNNVRIPFVYEDVLPFSDGIARVKKNNKWGFIDTVGNTVVPFEFDDFGWISFCDNEIVFTKNGKYGVIDRNLVVRIPPLYESLYLIHKGLYHFRNGPICGVRDRTGNEITSEEIWGSEKYPIG